MNLIMYYAAIIILTLGLTLFGIGLIPETKNRDTKLWYIFVGSMFISLIFMYLMNKIIIILKVIADISF